MKYDDIETVIAVVLIAAISIFMLVKTYTSVKYDPQQQCSIPIECRHDPDKHSESFCNALKFVKKHQPLQTNMSQQKNHHGQHFTN
jgi:hypothetical protein